MCGNPLKVVKNIFSPPKPQSPQVVVQDSGPDPQTMEQIRQQQEQLNKQRDEFMQMQKQFNEDQRKWLQEARQASTQPIVAPVVEKKQATAATASETERSISSRRKGRSSLRIPLSANVGASGTGLNIPRG
ncbi:hypothetical protein GTQ45_01945 [Pyruvatibacter mobilis]|uniref:Uncharacterized protein n=1 Tax=Pyruvatibacter mobilis TaxID=1712261 RepID=A0A845Q7C9_9HYPH|nr:hypothetical protein [Pyruvatibacter mobilis]NBG94493.1 hypothetical protein [Pyruvatibacter mobilis]QJD74013.1 hypothetical protein HG718_00495 [Pyruvatibacter mobilis]GGD03371.1 hypothetical protein GCM10011587_03880 [Pyruvatibacter mobilis]